MCALVEVRCQEVAEATSLGKVMFESGLFSDTKAMAQAIVKVLAGRELGIGPVAAMSSLFIIKGKVTLSAGLMAALIQRSEKYRYVVRHLDDSQCQLEFFSAEESAGMSLFTMNDAQRAGLTGSFTWKAYPRNMLFARALSNGAKWYCAEVFNGPVYVPEELTANETINEPVIDAVAISAQSPVVTISTKAESVDEDPIAALAKATGTELPKLLTYYNVNEISELSPSQRAEAMTVLTARITSTQEGLS